MSKNAPIPVPQPGESLVGWALANPEAVTRAIEAVNLLISLQVQLTGANSTRSDQNAIVLSPDRYLLPIPLKLNTAIADSSATAASVSTQLNLLLAALRRTGQLPS